MVAGVPGTGIGGIFYLLSALLMPIQELWHTIRGRSSIKRWYFVGAQMSLAMGVIFGFWATGLLLGMMLQNKIAKAQGATGLQTINNVLKVQPLFISLATLLVVLLSVQLLNFFFRVPLSRSFGKGSR